MTPNLSRRLLLVGSAAAAAVVVGAGGAAAYWTTSGSGSGSASTGDMTISTQPFAVGEVSTQQLLLPGRSADAVLKISNPNSFPVTLTDVRGTGAAAASNGCAPTGVSFAEAAGLTRTLDAGTTTIVDLPGAVSMSTESAAECQGASFTLPVLVTVKR